MLYRVLCFVLAVCAVFFSFSFCAFAESGGVSVSAKSAILLDADSGRALYEKNARIRMPMASTTKIMTALVALENCDTDETVKISPDAVGVEGSSVYLAAGEELTLGDLLYALLLSSANDAAEAIAIHVSGSVEGFVGLMNESAKRLGLFDTCFDNPHGLHSEKHYTTALDLARLTAYALRNESFLRRVSTYKYNIKSADGTVRYLVNHNRLLKSYDGCIGVKTGFTKKGGRCLVSAARRDGLTLVAVTLSAPDDWNDHKTMLDYGFSNYRSVLLCEKGEKIMTLHNVSGETLPLALVPTSSIRVTVKKGGEEIKRVVECPRFLWETPKENETVGRCVFYLGDKPVGETELIGVIPRETFR